MGLFFCVVSIFSYGFPPVFLVGTSPVVSQNHIFTSLIDNLIIPKLSPTNGIAHMTKQSEDWWGNTVQSILAVAVGIVVQTVVFPSAD